MSADGSKTPGSLFKSFQAALSTPRRLLNRVAGGASSPAAAAASGDAASENADKPVEQASAPMHSGSTPQQRPNVLQETKAENKLPGSLQQTLLQQTAGWDADKHAALERFFNRATGPASNSHSQQHAGRRGHQSAVLDILKNRPASQVRDGGAGPVRRGGLAARYTPYGRPAAGPSRTGAGHVNSADTLYSNAGKHRPLTPMPPSKPGAGPLAPFLQQPGAAQAAAGGSDTQLQQDVAATTGPSRQLPAMDGSQSAPGAQTSSLFAIAANNNNSNAAPLFPATANVRQSAAAFTDRPPSRSGFGGFGGGLGSSSNKDHPGLSGAGIPSAPKPVLGLPRARANKAPLMGAKRGAAGRQGAGPYNSVVAGAPGALKPMRNTPLKLGLPAPGSKRGSDMHGPNALDTAVVGHKRIRMATTPGPRAMSGLGTSPSSTGSRDGGSSSRTGLQAAGPGDAARQQDVVPVVQATSVAETIMDTMRSLEKGGSASYRTQQQESAAFAPPPLDRLDGGALRTQLFATPNFKQPQQQPRTPEDASPSGLTVGAPGTSPWARKPDAAAAPPTAPGSVAANKTPGSFFTPVSAAVADVPKMPHISPITPWTAGPSGEDGAFGTPVSAGARGSGQQRHQQTEPAGLHMKENGRTMYSFGASVADTQLYRAVAKVTGSVSTSDLERVQVSSFAFTSPLPIQFAAVAAAIDKQAISAQNQQQQQGQQRFERQDVPTGNPLLAPTWTAKFQQQQAATPASTPSGFLQSNAPADKPFGTPAIGGNSAMPKWGMTPAAAAAGGAGSSKAAAVSPSSPVFAIDATPADGVVDGMVLPPGCDPALLADQVKKAAEVPLPVDSEEEEDTQQQQQQGSDSGEKQQPAKPTPTLTPAANADDRQQRVGAGYIAAAAGAQQTKSEAVKQAKKANRFSVLDVMEGSDEEEPAVAPKLQVNGDVDKQQQQQQRETSRQEQQQQQQQQEDDAADRKRKKRVSFTPALASVPEATANGSPAITKPAFNAFKQQQQQTALPFGSPFGAPAPATDATKANAGDGKVADNGPADRTSSEAAAASKVRVPDFGATAAGTSAGFGIFGGEPTASGVKPFSFGVNTSITPDAANAEHAAAAGTTTMFGAAEPAPQQASATTVTTAAPSIIGVSAASASTPASAPAAGVSQPGFNFTAPPATTTTLSASSVSSGAAAGAEPGSTAQPATGSAAGFGFGVAGSTFGSTASQPATAAQSSTTTGAPALFSFGVPAAAASATNTAAGQEAAKPAAGAPGFGSFGASSSTAAPAAAGSTPSFAATGFTFGAIPAGGTAASAPASAAAGNASTPAASTMFSFGASQAAAASSSTPAFGANSSSAAAAAPTAAAATPFGFGNATGASAFTSGPSSAAAAAGASSAAVALGFAFGASASSGAAPAASSAPAVAFGTTAGGSSSSGPSLGFSFGVGPAAAPAPASTAAAAPGFTFGAAPAASSAATVNSAGSGSFGSFGAPAAAAAAAPSPFGAPAASGSGGISPAGSLQAPFNPAAPAAANPFGAPASSSTGGFGANPAAPGFSFGASAPAAAPPAAAPFAAAPFGSSQPGAGAPFGQQPQQQQPAAPFAFGATPQQQQQQPAAPFGAGPPAAGFAFGAQPPQQQLQPQQGFGAAPTFGAPQQQQQQQQQQAPAFGAFGAAGGGGDAGAMFTMGNMAGGPQQQQGGRRIVKARRKGGR